MDNKKKLAKETLIQSLLYHSRIERTPNYLNILQGIETYAFEGSSNHIDSVYRVIEENKSPSLLSQVLGLLGMTPGLLGKSAKGLRILDFGHKALGGLKGRNKQENLMSALENEIRTKVDNIFNRIASNPQLQNKINSYLPDKFGGFGKSSEEILASSPLYSDHLKLKIIDAMTAENSDRLNSIVSDLDEMKEKIAEWLDTKLTEQQYDARLKEIESYSTYGNLIGKLIGLDNPDLGNKIIILTEGYRKAATIASSVAAGKMTAGLATANYALIAISVYQSFSANGPSEIASAVAQLQDLIVDATEQILTRLDEIDSRLIDIQRSLAMGYREALELGHNVKDLHLKVDELDSLFIEKTDLLINAVKAGFSRELNEYVVTAIGHKDIWKAGEYKMNSEKFKETLIKLYSHAAVHSADKLSNTSELRNYSLHSVIDELGSSNLITNLPYLSNLLSLSTQKLYPKIEIDIGMWSLATAVLLDLIGDWPEHQHGLETDFLKEIRQHGLKLESFIDSCSIKNSLDAYISLLRLTLFHARAHAENYSKIIPGQLLKILQEQGSSIPLAVPASLDWKEFSASNFHQAFMEGDMGLKPFDIEVEYVNGEWGTVITKSPIELIAEHLPAEAKCALWMGSKISGNAIIETHSEQFPFAKTKIEFNLDIELVAPEGQKRESITILQAAGTMSSTLGREPANPDKEKISANYLMRLVSDPKNHDEHRVNVDKSIQKIRLSLPSLLKGPSLQLAQKVNNSITLKSATRKDLESISGVMELLWYSICVGGSETDRLALEKHFLGEKTPNPNFKLAGFSHSVSQALDLYESEINDLISVIRELADNSEIVTESNFWTLLNYSETLTNIDKCISSLENNTIFLTDYGRKRSVI